MGHDGVALGYPTPTGFRRLTGCQRDPGIGVSHKSSDMTDLLLTFTKV